MKTIRMFSATHVSRWDQLQMELQQLDQALSRRELEGLGDATFRNPGITRCDSHLGFIWDPHRTFSHSHVR